VNEYPVVGTESALQANGIMFSINVFQNPNSGRVVKVSRENFVVAFTKYSRFEDFKEEVIKRTDQFCQTFGVTALLRLGLRYVNNILVPPAEKTSAVLRYVRPIVDFDRIGVDDVEHFVTEVRMKRQEHLVTLRGALLAPLDDGRRVYILDIDCHSRAQQQATEVAQLLDIYHETAQVSFLDHITEEYKNVMRGRS
jgi:uncharacterized protein (TIGR04255 family)